MRRALLVLSLAVLPGCEQAKEPAQASAVLARAREIAARMCACADMACGAQLRTAWDELSQQLHGATFTEEQVEGLATEDQRFIRCMERLAK